MERRVAGCLCGFFALGKSRYQISCIEAVILRRSGFGVVDRSVYLTKEAALLCQEPENIFYSKLIEAFHR